MRKFNFLIALPDPQKRSHSQYPKTAISHPPTPKAIALPISPTSDRTPNIPKQRYRTPTPQKRSHSLHPQTAIAPQAIAPPHIPKQRSHFHIANKRIDKSALALSLIPHSKQVLLTSRGLVLSIDQFVFYQKSSLQEH